MRGPTSNTIWIITTINIIVAWLSSNIFRTLPPTGWRRHYTKPLALFRHRSVEGLSLLFCFPGGGSVVLWCVCLPWGHLRTRPQVPGLRPAHPLWPHQQVQGTHTLILFTAANMSDGWADFCVKWPQTVNQLFLFCILPKPVIKRWSPYTYNNK